MTCVNYGDMVEESYEVKTQEICDELGGGENQKKNKF